ncbi:hypothetical protein GGS21DRAFT_518690 [Xylaria nigripes]|nr:hypothetical protein GGS21DRAFT_518690 [Xylaria nigripes]
MSELTLDNFITGLQKQLESILEEQPPRTKLHSSDIDAIERSVALVQLQKNITKNTPKRRAKRILSDILKEDAGIFALCSLAFYPSHLGSLKSPEYISIINGWKSDERRTDLLDKFFNIVKQSSSLLSKGCKGLLGFTEEEPASQPRAAESEEFIYITISSRHLLQFLKENLVMTGVSLERHTSTTSEMELRIPGGANAGQPSIEMSQTAQLVVSWEAACRLMLCVRHKPDRVKQSISITISPAQLLHFFGENLGPMGVSLKRHTSTIPEMELCIPGDDAGQPFIVMSEAATLVVSWEAACRLMVRVRYAQ